MKKKDIAAVVLVFYVGWFGSVLLAGTAYPAFSLVFPVVLTAGLLIKKQLSRSALSLALAVSAIGVLFDSLQIRFGFVELRTNEPLGFPVWLISIWLLFSLSTVALGPGLRLPARWMALLGFVMGPLSYKSGEVFDVLTFAGPTTFLIYALFWSVMFPAVVSLSKRFT